MSKEIKILGVIAVAVIAAAIIGASFYRNSTPVATTPSSPKVEDNKSWKENKRLYEMIALRLDQKTQRLQSLNF